MKKITLFAVAAFLLVGALTVCPARADEPAPDAKSMDMAAVAPGKARTPVTAKNMPAYLDEDLATKHATFTSFARTKVKSFNRNHRLSRSRMQIVKQPDGSYLARYHHIDDQSLICKVRRSKSKTVPYVGVLTYKERVFEAVAESPDACRSAEFIPVAVIPSRHIFSYKQGAWN